MVVEREQARKLEAVHQFLQRRDDGENAAINLLRQGVFVDSQSRGLHRLRLDGIDPAIEHECQGAPLGACLGGEVADKFAVSGKSLSLGAVQTPLGR